MFTGLISDVGTIEAIDPRNDVRRIAIAAHYEAESIPMGASIACNGVCMSVVHKEEREGGCLFAVEAAPETLAVTTVSDWRAGDRINLERSLRIGDELGGHLVAAHVDGVAKVIAREDLGETTRLLFEAPPELARFIAPKGSVALNGTSLTVNKVEGNRFDCLLIPITLAETNWGDSRPGDRVNIEIDLMARYAARLVESRGL
jgi:riboflavin synthase